MAGAPVWLETLRRADLEWLKTADVPAFNDEAWKYTPLSSLWKTRFSAPAFHAPELPLSAGAWSLDGAFNIVLVNGRVAGKVEGLSGVKVFTGREALTALEGCRSCVEEITPNDAPVFIRLNRLFMSDVVLLEVGKNVKLDRPLQILHLITAPNAAVLPRVMVKVDNGAEISLLQTYVLDAAENAWQSPVTDVLLAEGAVMEYAEDYRDNGMLANFTGAVRVWQKKDSQWRSCVSTKGAGLFRSNLSVLLQESGAFASINGLHDLDGEAQADSHTFLDHQAPETASDQLYKCVLRAESHSVFNGRVCVKAVAQKTNSYQLNKNLLMSPTCKAHTKPQLEIKADDVKCTHGATIGRLDDDHLFYLRTRAISKDEAVNMLVKGFMDDVYSRVKHPVLRAALQRG